MNFEIKIEMGGEENARRYSFQDFDDAYNADWNEKVQSLIEDLQDFIKHKND